MNDNDAYAKVVNAMEQGLDVDEIRRLVASMADINHEDRFGLTMCMRAAALGRLDVVKEFVSNHKVGIDQRNRLTRANLLHYAAQQPEGGAEIVRWAMSYKDVFSKLVNEPILVLAKDREKDNRWDRGNGHTVAFEATFNNNVSVVKALLEIAREYNVNVDFETPSVLGLSPLGWAFKTEADDVAKLLKDKLYPNATNDLQKLKEKHDARERFEQEEEKWLKQHGNAHDHCANKIAKELRAYIVKGHIEGKSIEYSVDVELQNGNISLNELYGRFGQPLLNLVPTHPDIINVVPTKDQKHRYTEVVRMLIHKGADPMTREKGLMEVSAGFREVFFDYVDALHLLIESIKDRSKRDTFVTEQGLFNGYTRLIDAALIGRAEAIALLLAYSTDQNIASIRGFNGWTARDAAERGNIASPVLDLLFDALVGFRH